MKLKKLTTICLLLLCICLLAGCSCRHSWENATCDTPQTCRFCQETTGEPLAHNWVDATCQEPKHCSQCGLTEGNTVDHQWSALTCAEEYTCTGCNTASGEVGPHVDVRNIVLRDNDELTVTCSCGHEEELTIEGLMLHLMKGKWMPRAVLKNNTIVHPNPKENWQEGTWFEFPSAAEPVAYEVGTSAEGENFAFPQTLKDFQLTTAVLYSNGAELPVLMCNSRTDYNNEFYTEVPLILVFGDRNYAKNGMSDEEFINAAFAGTVTSLWCQREGIMYIYGYDVK